MDRDRHAALLVVLGVVLALAPAYWEALEGTGLAAALDWLAAVGVVPAGVYPAGVGGVLLGTGLGLLSREGSTGATVGGAVGAVLGTAAAAAAWALARGSPGVDAVLFGLAVGAVALAVPAGADPARRRRPLLVAAALVAPYAGRATFSALVTAGMGRAFGLLAVVLLVVLDVLVGYPLYRVGRARIAGVAATRDADGGTAT